MEAITYNEIRMLFLPGRKRGAHKGGFGRVLIVAGSKGMMGAAVLCARAALRTGSGLVTVSCAEKFFPIVQTAAPEATCIGRDIERALSAAALSKYDAVAVGPGLGFELGLGSAPGGGNLALLSHILANYEGTLVLDADALNIIAAETDRFHPPFSPRTILTPHAGEAARLLGLPGADGIEKDREAALHALRHKFGGTIVLKGADTFVTPNRVNTTGNPGMAAGGSGDVLTGVIVSLAGQGFPAETAAAAGVYLHGLAGDIMAGEIGEAGLTAG
ncbi:MAG: NAD(P)H-hydrate dehydratase, partial [Clostridiales Family XIII bacterium]|nr:NAD(P)H-hydrate dehydratase [Clostridiales Family XIII bacterium]